MSLVSTLWLIFQLVQHRPVTAAVHAISHIKLIAHGASVDVVAFLRGTEPQVSSGTASLVIDKRILIFLSESFVMGDVPIKQHQLALLLRREQIKRLEEISMANIRHVPLR